MGHFSLTAKRIAGLLIGVPLTLIGMLGATRGGLLGAFIFVGAFSGGWLFCHLKTSWKASDYLAVLMLAALMMLVFHRMGFFFSIVFLGAIGLSQARGTSFERGRGPPDQP